MTTTHRLILAAAYLLGRSVGRALNTAERVIARRAA